MQKLLKIPYYTSVALLAYMPFHIFLSQWISTYTTGLELWKIGKDIVLFGVVLFTICSIYYKRQGTRAFSWLVGATVVFGLVHLGIWLAHPDIYVPSAQLGVIYNVRLLFYVILGYGSVLLWPKFAFSSLERLLIGLAVIVAGLGIVQYFLPPDFLTHFGYALDRGTRPVFFVDGNPDLPIRIMSTLREPNALGAYLLLPILLTIQLYGRSVSAIRRRLLLIAGAIQLAALVLTLSRSAWLGLFVGALCLLCWRYCKTGLGILRRWWPIVAVLCLLVVPAGYAVRDTDIFQSYVVHAGASQPDDPNSNGYHLLFIRRGLDGILQQPLGHGPGTAGLASIRNPAGSFLTENYYVQLGYELGVIGLALFVWIQVWLYRHIRQAGQSALVLSIMAAFWGYVVTNMLLHTWSNEAVTAQWWILAGIIIGSKMPRAKKPQTSLAK